LGPFAEGRNNILSNPTLTAIAEDHGKTVAQAVLRWLIQRNVVAIPKSVRPDRMAENLDIFDFQLTEDQVATIATLDTGARALPSTTAIPRRSAGSATSASTPDLPLRGGRRRPCKVHKPQS
jgi:diketogulonate reductase-like aldo/keto reductase